MFVVGAVLPEQKSFTKILSSLCKEVLVKKDASQADIVVQDSARRPLLAPQSAVLLLNADKRYESAQFDKEIEVISCGINSKATVTASSIEKVEGSVVFNLCVQRKMLALDGREIEPQEIKVCIEHENCSLFCMLAAVTCGLLCGKTAQKAMKTS